MPHSIKSQSPPHLRLLSAQGSNRGLPFGVKSMRTSASFLPNASVRRISSPRRPRPVATSVADFFVRSLVLAGYCHEHSPHSRYASTMSAKALNGAAKEEEARGTGGTRKQFSSKGPPACWSSRVQGLRAHRPKTQRMFNSSVAQRLETYDAEDRRVEQTHEHRSHVSDVKSKHADRLGTEPVPPLSRKAITSDHTHVDISPPAYPNRATDHDAERKEVDLEQNPLRDREDDGGAKSHKKKLYDFASELYQAVFGSNWREAVDAVVPFQHFPPQTDTTTSAVELSSVQKLIEALLDKKKSNHYVFTLYRDLPSPGVAHLSKRDRGTLLRRFAHPRDRRWVDARRYLALVEDMVTAGFPLSRSLWSSAIHLAGRATSKTTKQDLVRAIGLWNQMEHVAGIQSDGVVFGILFDIAIKAGQYTVADRLLKEMERRGLQFGRAGKVTRIYYYGLVGDADAVYRAFDEFVEGGEIVDIAVMNCLMASLLKAGETKTTEQMYQRLLQAPATQPAVYSKQLPAYLASPNLTSELTLYRKRNKKVGLLLELSASLKDSLPEHHRALQEAILLAPDTRTFHIFLSHHAYRSGNLKALTSVLDDMEKFFSVPPRGMVYLLIFDGFAHQSRYRKSWSAEKLWMVWNSYLQALYESKARLHRRSPALPASVVWKNPLRNNAMLPSSTSTTTPPTPSSSSVTADAQEGLSESREEDGHQISGKGEVECDNATSKHNGAIDVSAIHVPAREGPHKPEDLETLERRIENGVFLGRRMIIIILRAFGACCGHDDVMEVWLRMESIWEPGLRKGLDVLAVKEELQRQLERTAKRHRY
ncbi:hypothetical protein BJX61DRAFT_526289 [Aspergillus egyptiacus]|nr:hypothetical protein BJX61DRAFT_526289 [Aspergillus egyptiacus]